MKRITFKHLSITLAATLLLCGKVSAHDRIHAHWMANSDGFANSQRIVRPVVGFVACDMHAQGGPTVMMVQIARGQADFDAERLVGQACADGLLRLQSQGLRLGQSRIVPASTATTDPDCLAWDIIGPEFGP